MREDEANFIAFLACLQSDDPEFRYSGVYLASVHAMNALWHIVTGINTSFMWTLTFASNVNGQ